jgi:hypothetical protein
MMETRNKNKNTPRAQMTVNIVWAWRLLLASLSSQPFVRSFVTVLSSISPSSPIYQPPRLVMVRGGLLVAILFPPCCSPLPPCEQWLTAVVWGAAVITVVMGPGVVVLALAVGVNTRDPPCEQLLAGVGAGAVSSVTIRGCCGHSSLSWGHRGGQGLFLGVGGFSGT